MTKKNPYKISQLSLICAFYFSLWTPNSNATTLHYSVSPLKDDIWRYDYTIANIDLPTEFDELTVYFDVGVYESLTYQIAPSGWEPIVIQPETELLSDGFYDALSLVGAPADATPIFGFSVSFVYKGVGTPGAQPFELINSSNFSVIQRGTTQLLGPIVRVPEPSTLTLLLSGLLSAACTFRGRIQTLSAQAISYARKA